MQEEIATETEILTCQVDADCDGTRICFVGVSDLESNPGQCLCNSFYGWVGSDCLEFGSATHFQIGSISFQLIAVTGLLVLCIPLFIAIRRTEKNWRSLSSITFLSLIIGLLGLLTLRVASLIIVLSPGDLTFFKETDHGDEQKYNRLSSVLEIPALMLALSSGMFAFNNTTLMCKSARP